jgi:hypothetical protein
VAGGEPEAEHGGREEGGNEQLRAERRRAQRRRELDLAQLRHGAGEPVAVGAPQPPEPREREQEDRRPAQQPVVPVDEESYQAVDALEVAAGEGRVGGRLARDVGRVRCGTAVKRLVHPHEDSDAEQRQLDRADGERATSCPPQGPGGHETDDQPGGHELGAEPGQEAEQGEAAERVQAARPRVEPDREQSRRGDRRARRELGIDGAPVGEERR